MNTTEQINEKPSASEAGKGQAKKKPVSELVLATNLRRQQAARAGKVKQAFLAHPKAQFLMNFADFRNPARRNKVLRDYGLEPVTLPREVPTPLDGKYRKRKRKSGRKPSA